MCKFFQCSILGFPKFEAFLASVIHRTHAPLNAIALAVLYIHRLSRLTLSSNSPHRIMITALMIACKFLYDDTYSNATWVEVCKHRFTRRELSKMEWEFLGFINYNLIVQDDEWTDFLHLMDSHISNLNLKSNHFRSCDSGYRSRYLMCIE